MSALSFVFLRFYFTHVFLNIMKELDQLQFLFTLPILEDEIVQRLPLRRAADLLLSEVLENLSNEVAFVRAEIEVVG